MLKHAILPLFSPFDSRAPHCPQQHTIRPLSPVVFDLLDKGIFPPNIYVHKMFKNVHGDGDLRFY